MNKPPKEKIKASSKRWPKLSKKRVVIAAFVVFVLASLILPILWPNGSEKYSSVKQEAAIKAVEFVWSSLSGIDYATSFGTIKVSVDGVALGGADSQLCHNEFVSKNDLAEGNDFLVTVVYRGLFGLPIDTATFHICRIP